MHFLMLVTLAVPATASSEEVRCAVREALLNDDSFCGSGGRFGSALSDWFVIGGRWSGYLSMPSIGDAFRQAVRDRFPDQEYSLDLLVKEHSNELDAIWQKVGGLGTNAYGRDQYETRGYTDDAQMLSSELYDALLSEFENCDSVIDSGHCMYVDLDGDMLGKGFIGKKWLVVVDYHN